MAVLSYPDRGVWLHASVYTQASLSFLASSLTCLQPVTRTLQGWRRGPLEAYCRGWGFATVLVPFQLFGWGELYEKQVKLNRDQVKPSWAEELLQNWFCSVTDTELRPLRVIGLHPCTT